MNSKKIIGIMKIVLVLCLLAFVINVTKYKTNDCQLCSFTFNNTEIKIGTFMDYYFNECLVNRDVHFLINKLNQNGGIINE